MEELLNKLQKPFPADCIEWRVGSTTKDKSKGLALAYLTNRAIMDRLDEVFGVMGWQNQFKEWKGTSQICGISVWDDIKKEWITKWDGADDSHTEAVKGGLSDSMKRCGYQWGIGRYLYKLPQIWVALKNEKYLAEIPKLPSWALPEGTKEDKEPSYPQKNKTAKEGTKETGKLVCENCGIEISERTAMFSTSKYKKKLCFKCQKAQ